MNDPQGADDSANMTHDFDDWHYREIEPIPPVEKALNLYLIAVIVLGASALAAIAFIGVLAWNGKEIPTELGSLGLVSLSAIAGMVYVKQTTTPK